MAGANREFVMVYWSPADMTSKDSASLSHRWWPTCLYMSMLKVDGTEDNKRHNHEAKITTNTAYIHSCWRYNCKRKKQGRRSSLIPDAAVVKKGQASKESENTNWSDKEHEIMHMTLWQTGGKGRGLNSWNTLIQCLHYVANIQYMFYIKLQCEVSDWKRYKHQTAHQWWRLGVWGPLVLCCQVANIAAWRIGVNTAEGQRSTHPAARWCC